MRYIARQKPQQHFQPTIRERQSIMKIRTLFYGLLALLPLSAFAAGSDVVGENLLWLALILMSARLFAPLARTLRFPAVLGELLLGVVLGNLTLFGIDYFDAIAKDPIIAFIAELGVIVLLLADRPGNAPGRSGQGRRAGVRRSAASASSCPLRSALSSSGRCCCRGRRRIPTCSSAPRWRRPRSASPAASSATSASSVRRRRASCSARR